MRHLYIILLLLVWSLSGTAQVPVKHSRVLEVEKYFTNEAHNIIRDFIGSQPFSVNVRIDPLHRNRVEGAKERLPYFEGGEEIRDEWDDPNRTEFDLISRVVKVSVLVNLSKEITDLQVADLRESLRIRLGLVDGRDILTIEKKDWLAATPQNQYTSWILGLGVGLLFVFGVIFFLISLFSISRITQAIRQVRLQIPEGGFGGSASAAMSPRSAPTTSGSSQRSDISAGQIQFNDTIKMTEVILNMIKSLEKSSVFPTLEDMILFESYLETSPKSVGGLIGEFPLYLREKIFSYSYSEKWLRALSEPCEVDSVSFELMNKLVKGMQSKDDSKWEELLVCVWRLNRDIANFLKQVPHEDALAILLNLPQSLAIRVGREVMPGEWAIVLRQRHLKKKLTPEKVEKYQKMALKMASLRTLDTLAVYKKEIDLIQYLRTVDPVIEKEVYGAVPEDSLLRILRPPFYIILEVDQESLKDFIPQVSIDDWAVSLLNTPKPQRVNIEGQFSDRQKFQFVEVLKRHDKAGVDFNLMGMARERIGAAFAKYLEEKNISFEEKSNVARRPDTKAA